MFSVSIPVDEVHAVFVTLIDPITIAEGCVMITVETALQEFPSVTVILYVPALRAESVCPVAPLLQE